MTKKTHLSPKKNALIAALLLLLPLILFILWLSAGSGYGDLNETQMLDNYLSYFPSVIHNAKIIFIISLVFCLLAIVFSSKNFKREKLPLRISMFVVCLAAIVILLFDIYHLLH